MANATPPAALLPEVAEAQATGATREIYAEMKRLGAVPMVALIFRHLATLPGALEWTWSAVRPAMESGALQEAAWRIAGAAPLEPLAPMPSEALSVLGVDGPALREIHVVADAYNRANPTNLLTVRCLAHLLGGGSGGGVPAVAWRPPPVPQPLVPMGDAAAMPAEVAALLRLVARNESGGTTQLVPSLYRHFMHRPRFLALLVTLLLPRFDDGSIARGVATIRAGMDAEALRLAGALRAPPAPHPDIAGALERFGVVIPQMIVVGRLLKAALPAPR